MIPLLPLHLGYRNHSPLVTYHKNYLINCPNCPPVFPLLSMLCRLLSGACTMNHHLFFPLTLATPFHTENLADTPHGLHHSLCHITTRILVPYTSLTPMTCLASFFATPGTPNWPCTLFSFSCACPTLSLRIHFGLAHCPSVLSLMSWESTLPSLPTHLPHFALTFLFSLPPPLPPLPLPAEFAMIHSLLLHSLFILNPIQLPS